MEVFLINMFLWFVQLFDIDYTCIFQWITSRVSYLQVWMHILQEKVGLGSSPDSGKGKSKISKHITHGFHLVKGKSHHDMEDYVVAQFKEVDDNELGLFAIFDGHLSHVIPDYLRSHLFDNILKEVRHSICAL